MVLTDQPEEVDILFLCLPHKESQNWLTQNPVKDETLVIDLGNDFRLDGNLETEILSTDCLKSIKNNFQERKALPIRDVLQQQFNWLASISSKRLLNEVYTTGITGSTGAGQSLQATTHFTWRNDNISAYKTLTHQHVDEILQQLVSFNTNEISLNFVPWRGDFARGIFTSSTMKTDLELSEIYQLFEDFYADEPFVQVSEKAIDLKQVVNTNRCVIQIEKVEMLRLFTQRLTIC
jgi:N-acetyl-gamma-glutamyl-phosphate reductase